MDTIFTSNRENFRFPMYKQFKKMKFFIFIILYSNKFNNARVILRSSDQFVNKFNSLESKLSKL